MTRGFLEVNRELPPPRAVPVRLKDWREVYEDFPAGSLEAQASRCMDCGVPFCNQGCPLGNLIPDWNDLIYRSRWSEAIEALHATNNFPDFTGRLCPAPCESACVLGINADPVTIKQVEFEIIDRAWEEGWVRPVPPGHLTGKSVAVVGSGPAGLAAAQQLTRAGHLVTVYERADRVGGLLRYGIPEFKLEKRVIDRRLAQMRAEGTRFVTNTDVGVDVSAAELRSGCDAVVLAGGATNWRDLPIPGREATGVYQAMEYLPLSNRVQEGDFDEPSISARGKAVVIIGGGDTGADCLGTALRQGATSVHQFEIMERPPTYAPMPTPGPAGRLPTRCPQLIRKGANASMRCRPRHSSSTTPAACGGCATSKWNSTWSMGAPASMRCRAPRPNCRWNWRSWPWASPDPMSHRCWLNLGWNATPGPTWHATTPTPAASTGCTCAATWVGDRA